jgi:predicted naringenin-chalcone synthase
VRVVIGAIGLSTPTGVLSQAQALDLMVREAKLDGESLRLARAVFARSGIAQRGSVICDVAGGQTMFTGQADAPGTAARMEAYARLAPPLAESAAREALRRDATEAGRVTHLVTASCTGFAAPGVDLALIARLGLRATTARVHVGFMGCHAAINALATAAAIVQADPSRVVLVVCVELSTLHLQPTSRDDHIVSGALFGDGAAACVVRAGRDGGEVGETGEICATASTIIPDSSEVMGWNVGDFGFAMTLGPRVPELIGEHVGAFLAPVLAGCGIDDARAARWCVHPGGPRVLEAVRGAMSLPTEALQASRDVLHDHGNMSSATVLFILQRLRENARGDALARRAPIVLLAFGPGLCAEAAVVGG